MFDGEQFADFVLLCRLLPRVPRCGADGRASPLAAGTLAKVAIEHGTRALDQLRAGVKTR